MLITNIGNSCKLVSDKASFEKLLTYVSAFHDANKTYQRYRKNYMLEGEELVYDKIFNIIRK